ncbi:uncharacterized protein LOC130237393 [Danio aesculapii]|uniref:uncharacterized protein LOC130237393 n=1 Tax=Danio aesculapii TaxID=1142201 RepID=UPI0024BF549E|nr:uncharacterized protein LOC130237393 [Danio aesculapii]
MAGNRQLGHHGHNGNDEDDDILYTNELWGGRHPGVLKISSDINKNLLKQETWRCKKRVTKKPKMKLVSAGVDIGETFKIIDTFDREPDAYAEGTYARQSGYKAGLTNEPGQRIPKTGYSAEAGIGRARAECSVFEAEAKGPNASVGAEISVLGAGAMARAEIASASASAGPVGVKVGLGVDTGASIGVDGLEAKFLGTGISIGPKTSVAVLGSEVSCSVM